MLGRRGLLIDRMLLGPYGLQIAFGGVLEAATLVSAPSIPIIVGLLGF